jgi:hypothetical protein
MTAEHKTIHCQGQAVFSHRTEPVKHDIEWLKGQMTQDILEPSSVYAMLAKMGLNYGPAHRAIIAIYPGENQLLAQLRLPAIVETSQPEYVLHPSLMDGALQASIGLIVHQIPNSPSLPFALTSLRILSACTNEMAAWVRRAEGGRSNDKAFQLDVDLCDHQGNVCVQMRGFATRPLEHETRSNDETMITSHPKSHLKEDNGVFDSAFYRKLIADVSHRAVSVDEAVDLG